MSIHSPITVGRPRETANRPNRRLVWLPVISGLAVLYLPTLTDLLNGIWATDQQAHGPIVLGIACWLIYRKWPNMWRVSEGQPTVSAGWAIFVFGLLLYIIGRSQDILVFEIGSVIWLLAAITLLVRGAAALKSQWFPLFMLFMIPLPGAIVDALTMPMKMAVSYVAEHILFRANSYYSSDRRHLTNRAIQTAGCRRLRRSPAPFYAGSVGPALPQRHPARMRYSAT